MAQKQNNGSHDFFDAFRRGEESAFDSLFRAYHGPLTFYAFNYIKDEQAAEDIVQECFVRIWERRNKLQHIESVNAYLYRCIFNECQAYLKKHKKEIIVAEFNEQQTEPAIVEAEALAQIVKLMDTLPLRMQQVVKMYYLEEKSLVEIGKEIGIDPETARSHRYRAIQLLRKTIIPG